MKRLNDRVAIVVGAGQSPGAGLGIGRATALKLGHEGALILAIDRDLKSVEETAAKVAEEGGTCVAFQADVTDEAALAVAVARERWGRIDIVNYNVGVSLAAGDAALEGLTEAAFDRVNAVNLRGAIMMAKHILPVMQLREKTRKVIGLCATTSSGALHLIQKIDISARGKSSLKRDGVRLNRFGIPKSVCF